MGTKDIDKLSSNLARERRKDGELWGMCAPPLYGGVIPTSKPHTEEAGESAS